MSSPLYKHTNDNSAMKQRKAKSTNTAKSTTNLDSRTELADLVKRKAEIAVGWIFKLFYTHTHKENISNLFHLEFYFIGNTGKFRATNLCI